MPTYEDIAERQSELIRKALAGSLFIADDDATLPTSLTTGADADLAALPTGYTDLGWISKSDGISWSREINVSNVDSWGSFDPTRRDINSNVSSLQFTAQETKLKVLELYHGVDLSGVTPTAVTGEVAFNEATRPATRYYRAFGIFVDGTGDDAIYVGRLLPRVMVSEPGDQVWTDGDDPVAYQMTLSATVDSTAGYSIRHFFGGPGWRSLLTAMGFPALTP